jgi:hypothetical protein
MLLLLLLLLLLASLLLLLLAGGCAAWPFQAAATPTSSVETRKAALLYGTFPRLAAGSN